jgi:hypothetical protein
VGPRNRSQADTRRCARAQASPCTGSSSGSGSQARSDARSCSGTQARGDRRPGLVWVNTASKVYHCPTDRYYGKTKAGKYLSEPAAQAEGDKPDAGKKCF